MWELALAVAMASAGQPARCPCPRMTVLSLTVWATGKPCTLPAPPCMQAFGRARLCGTPPATLAALLAVDTCGVAGAAGGAAGAGRERPGGADDQQLPAGEEGGRSQAVSAVVATAAAGGSGSPPPAAASQLLRGRHKGNAMPQNCPGTMWTPLVFASYHLGVHATLPLGSRA